MGRYGWRRDLPDQRDRLYAPQTAPLPQSASLRAEMPPVYNQGSLGACSAHSIAAILEHGEAQNGPAVTPSRLFIYYGERALKGTVASDSGAAIRDGIKVVASLGAPPETDWPYDIHRFAERPPERAYADARRYEALSYARVPQTTRGLQAVLAQGFPVSFGFTVYESFETDVGTDGVVPMPEPWERPLGGHAVVATGYLKIARHIYFEVRNSWGEDWGDGGYCYLPALYLTDRQLASDFWLIRQVSG